MVSGLAKGRLCYSGITAPTQENLPPTKLAYNSYYFLVKLPHFLYGTAKVLHFPLKFAEIEVSVATSITSKVYPE